MRIPTILALVALLACEVTAHGGRSKTGQARSAEVLAKRTAASPRGAKEWGGISMAYIHNGQKEVRGELRGAGPGRRQVAYPLGKDHALVSIREIVGKHLGLSPGQLASKDRRHERAVMKQLRRMLRDLRTARRQGRSFYDAFPGLQDYFTYRDLEAALTGEIASIKARQDASHRSR